MSSPRFAALAFSLAIIAPAAAYATESEKSYLPPASLQAKPAGAARTANAVPAPASTLRPQPSAGGYRAPRPQRLPYYHRYAFSRSPFFFPFFRFLR